MNWCKALLSSPPSPVSDTFGKKEALATPICELAETMFCSAWRNVLGDGLFGKHTSAGNGLGIFAEQNAEHVLLLLNLPFEIGDRLRSCVDELLCLTHVEPGA
jgi:hypothetical protein